MKDYYNRTYGPSRSKLYFYISIALVLLSAMLLVNSFYGFIQTNNAVTNNPSIYEGLKKTDANGKTLQERVLAENAIKDEKIRKLEESREGFAWAREKSRIKFMDKLEKEKAAFDEQIEALNSKIAGQDIVFEWQTLYVEELTRTFNEEQKAQNDAFDREQQILQVQFDKMLTKRITEKGAQK